MPKSALTILREHGFRVLTRDQWETKHEALYQKRREIRPFQLPARDFFAHVTVTFDSGNFTGDFKKDVRLVEQIGLDRFGTGISYTWVVDKNSGLIARGHPVDAKGAHTINDKGISGFDASGIPGSNGADDLNSWGHAIAWIGVPGNKPSRACIRSYAAIIAASKRAGIARPKAHIYPHSKFAAKDCPLESMRVHLDEVQELSRRILD